jgi:uncharacterized protein YjaZ
MGIPVFAGYAFAYRMVRQYAEQQQVSNYQDLYRANPLDIFNAYITK